MKSAFQSPVVSKSSLFFFHRFIAKFFWYHFLNMWIFFKLNFAFLILLLEKVLNLIHLSCVHVRQNEIVGQIIAIETINAIPEQITMLISECRHVDRAELPSFSCNYLLNFSQYLHNWEVCYLMASVPRYLITSECPARGSMRDDHLRDAHVLPTERTLWLRLELECIFMKLLFNQLLL